MRFLILLCSCFSSVLLLAQKEINYIAPPTIEADDCNLFLKDIVSKEDYCKFRLTIKNKSNDFYAYNTQEVGFNYDNAGTYKPKKGKFKVIEPQSQVAFVPQVNGNFDFRRPNFKLELEGLRKVSTTSVVALSDLNLSTDATVQADAATITVKKATFKKGKLSFSLLVEYKGDPETFVRLKTDALTTSDGQAVSLNGKDFRIVHSNDKITLAGDIEVASDDVVISFGEALQLYRFAPVALPTTIIYQEGTLVPTIPAVTQSSSTTIIMEGSSTIPATTNTYTAASCTPVTAAGTGTIKMNLFNAERNCFIVYINGALLSQQYTSNISFNVQPGKQLVELHFQNGLVLNDKFLIHPAVISTAYQVKPKKDKWVFKQILTSTVTDPNYVSPLEQRFGDKGSNTASGNNSGGGLQITTSSSSSSSTTVNGKTTSSSSKSSSSTIKVK